MPLTTGHWPLFFRSTLHARPTGSGRAQTLPQWLLPDTDNRIGKERTGPDLDERPVHLQYVTEIQYVTKPDVSDRIPRLRVFDLKSLENKNL